MSSSWLLVETDTHLVVCTFSDKSPTKTTQAIKGIVISVTVIMTIVAMRFVNIKIDVVKQRVIYARQKARQVKLSESGTVDSINPSSSWSSAPRDDEPEAPPTPFIPLAQRDSMDVVHPDTNTPRALPSPQGAPAASGSTSRGYEGKYDDPFGGPGVDMAALRTTRRSPPPGTHWQSSSKASSLADAEEARRT